MFTGGILWRSSGWDSVLSLPRAWVKYLVRKLRLQHSAAKKKKRKCSLDITTLLPLEGSGTPLFCEKHSKVKVLVTQSCPTLCDPTDCNLPGSSVHGVSQARILEWAAIPFSRGSSWHNGTEILNQPTHSPFFSHSDRLEYEMWTNV